MSHQVSVDPVDDAGINVSNLEERGHLWVPGTTINPEHVSHAPSTIGVSDDHRHSTFDVKEDWICFGRSNDACMINQHTPFLYACTSSDRSQESTISSAHYLRTIGILAGAFSVKACSLSC